MTYEEAKRILNTFIEINGRIELPIVIQGVTKGIEALEKQIPKKPKTKKESEYSYCYDCANCGGYIISKIDGEWIAGRRKKYCDHCGQAIDWSDEK